MQVSHSPFVRQHLCFGRYSSCQKRCVINYQGRKHWLYREDRFPRYTKYLTKKQLEKLNLDEWVEITRQERPEEVTFWSTVIFAPYWIKYNLVPMWMRYIWFVIWSAIRIRLYNLHKKACLIGAQFDSFLTQIGTRGKYQGFSQVVVMKRYRGQRHLLQDFLYRLKLLFGILKPQYSIEEINQWQQQYQQQQQERQ
eukprot:TRINITY_DN22962_c0_g1_i5.p2 TRINITY_DN22962_c0_g1~~TRINITY_DN22962_c0_g1_i5.p2  ORF type:complete len:207 (-),score=-2.56 TRINITY_DN22962_c0_g1_i5:186-773(-)